MGTLSSQGAAYAAPRSEEARRYWRTVSMALPVGLHLHLHMCKPGWETDARLRLCMLSVPDRFSPVLGPISCCSLMPPYTRFPYGHSCLHSSGNNLSQTPPPLLSYWQVYDFPQWQKHRSQNRLIERLLSISQ